MSQQDGQRRFFRLNDSLKVSYRKLRKDVTQPLTYKLRQVNISACGVAFPVEERLDVGQMLSLYLILRPDKGSVEQISTPAIVVACDELPQSKNGNQFYIRLNYDHFNPEAQQRLFQYLTKRQVQMHKHDQRAR